IIKPFKIMDLLGRVDKLVARSIENRSEKTGRKEERLRIVADCEIFKEDGRRVLAAKSQDVSLNGLKVRYAGGPLKPRTTVLVSVKMNFLDLLIGAMIVWSKAVSMHDSVAGLRLNDPIPPSSLSALSRLNGGP
ncbi:MAG: PilZ domain-containing protein, partial [Deltaproteobacteria bacterium]|nr:PilZ domain-containing protein [Deltaproteobacteria bacterium]